MRVFLKKNKLTLVFSLWLFFILLGSLAGHAYARWKGMDKLYVLQSTFVNEFGEEGGRIYHWLCGNGALHSCTDRDAKVVSLSIKNEEKILKQYPADAETIKDLLKGTRSFFVIGIVFLCLIWPGLLFLSHRPLRSALLPMFAHREFISFLTVMVLGGGYLSWVNQAPLFSFGYLASLVLVLILAFSFSALMSDEQMRTALAIYSILGLGVFLIYAVIYNAGLFSFRARLPGSLLAVNELAVICIPVVLAALLHAKRGMILFVFVPAFWVLLLTNSRASVLAIVCGLFSWFCLTREPLWTVRKRIFSGLFLIISFVLFLSFFDSIYVFLMDFFRFNNIDKGLESSLSGRTEIWSRVWGLFRESPWTGQGWRMTEYYMGVRTHNAFLGVLTDVGIPGAFVLTYFVFRSFFNYLKAAKRFFAKWALVVIVTFLINSCFEDYLFSTGNAGSILLLVILVRGFAGHHSGLVRKGNFL